MPKRSSLESTKQNPNSKRKSQVEEDDEENGEESKTEDNKGHCLKVKFQELMKGIPPKNDTFRRYMLTQLFSEHNLNFEKIQKIVFCKSTVKIRHKYEIYSIKTLCHLYTELPVNSTKNKGPTHARHTLEMELFWYMLLSHFTVTRIQHDYTFGQSYAIERQATAEQIENYFKRAYDQFGKLYREWYQQSSHCKIPRTLPDLRVAKKMPQLPASDDLKKSKQTVSANNDYFMTKEMDLKIVAIPKPGAIASAKKRKKGVNYEETPEVLRQILVDRRYRCQFVKDLLKDIKASLIEESLAFYFGRISRGIYKTFKEEVDYSIGGSLKGLKEGISTLSLARLQVVFNELCGYKRYNVPIELLQTLAISSKMTIADVYYKIKDTPRDFSFDNLSNVIWQGNSESTLKACTLNYQETFSEEQVQSLELDNLLESIGLNESFLIGYFAGSNQKVGSCKSRVNDYLDYAQVYMTENDKDNVYCYIQNGKNSINLENQGQEKKRISSLKGIFTDTVTEMSIKELDVYKIFSSKQKGPIAQTLIEGLHMYFKNQLTADYDKQFKSLQEHLEKKKKFLKAVYLKLVSKDIEEQKRIEEELEKEEKCNEQAILEEMQRVEVEKEKAAHDVILLSDNEDPQKSVQQIHSEKIPSSVGNGQKQRIEQAENDNDQEMEQDHQLKSAVENNDEEHSDQYENRSSRNVLDKMVGTDERMDFNYTSFQFAADFAKKFENLERKVTTMSNSFKQSVMKPKKLKPQSTYRTEKIQTPAKTDRMCQNKESPIHQKAKLQPTNVIDVQELYRSLDNAAEKSDLQCHLPVTESSYMNYQPSTEKDKDIPLPIVQEKQATDSANSTVADQLSPQRLFEHQYSEERQLYQGKDQEENFSIKVASEQCNANAIPTLQTSNIDSLTKEKLLPVINELEEEHLEKGDDQLGRASMNSTIHQSKEPAQNQPKPSIGEMLINQENIQVPNNVNSVSKDSLMNAEPNSEIEVQIQAKQREDLQVIQKKESSQQEEVLELDEFFHPAQQVAPLKAKAVLIKKEYGYDVDMQILYEDLLPIPERSARNQLERQKLTNESGKLNLDMPDEDDLEFLYRTKGAIEYILMHVQARYPIKKDPDEENNEESETDNEMKGTLLEEMPAEEKLELQKQSEIMKLIGRILLLENDPLNQVLEKLQKMHPKESDEVEKLYKKYPVIMKFYALKYLQKDLVPEMQQTLNQTLQVTEEVMSVTQEKKEERMSFLQRLKAARIISKNACDVYLSPKKGKKRSANTPVQDLEGQVRKDNASSSGEKKKTDDVRNTGNPNKRQKGLDKQNIQQRKDDSGSKK